MGSFGETGVGMQEQQHLAARHGAAGVHLPGTATRSVEDAIGVASGDIGATLPPKPTIVI